MDAVRFQVKGTFYRGREVVTWINSSLQVGDLLQLEEQPDNPHDPLAVAVLCQGTHIGFVPKHLTLRIGGNYSEARVLSLITGQSTVVIAATVPNSRPGGPAATCEQAGAASAAAPVGASASSAEEVGEEARTCSAEGHAQANAEVNAEGHAEGAAEAC